MRNFGLLFTVLLFLNACQSEQQKEHVYTFQTMGTYGMVKFISNTAYTEAVASKIDSVLLFVNQSMSTYIPDSEINQYSTLFGSAEFQAFEAILSQEFLYVLAASDSVYSHTQGVFNPLVKPLIDYWGFGPGKSATVVDSADVKSILECIDYSRFMELRADFKEDSNALCFQLDFSAIAKGYGVDLVAQILDAEGIENYMVEIGGEVNCRGVNSKGENWKIGIEKPNEDERALYASIKVVNKSVATSGNYRNFKVLDSGQKVVHIVDPRTGFPVSSNLLSATIIAQNCMMADAYATACMVMGLNDCYEFILSTEDLGALLIFSDESGKLSYLLTPEIEMFVEFF
jgi:FAD:protein FMN transferase